MKKRIKTLVYVVLGFALGLVTYNLLQDEPDLDWDYKVKFDGDAYGVYIEVTNHENLQTILIDSETTLDEAFLELEIDHGF